MKKIVLLLLLVTVLASVSVVSAADNLSVSDNPLGIDDVEDVSLDNGASDVNPENNNDDVLEINQEANGVDANDDNLKSADDSNVLSSSAKSAGDSEEKTYKQIPTKATTKNVKSTYGTQAKYTLKLVDQYGKVIVGKNVTFKVNNHVYKIKTNSNGIATLKLNLNAGKYVIKYSVGDLKGKNTYTVSNKVTLTILKWGNKGDVSKIRLLKKNMPNNKWVKLAVKATKKGNPLLKFQGGKGKKVFLTAGVHGNELSSQVAAMKLISYLTKNPIKGTVYIIPFVNIKAISHKVRHTGVDYNRVAHKSGTISNKIVKLVKKYKCDAYGDFHTTQPGGIPGKNIVMGSKSPATKCKSMTNYIAKYAKVNKRIYKYAGEQYPGALADNVNKKGISGVICEVMLPHNTVTTKTVKTSLLMMKGLLKFNSVI